ncbi:MAG: ParB/RepB/Spo0J family partition protein [Neisseriaceae bacterium]|nr:ParB/RepB/Spo0J family partition protein [Neisseriaceae bacterium]
MTKKIKGLGKGLDSLLSSGIDSIGNGDKLSVLPINKIEPGRYQPRSQMDDDALQELADSIRIQGVIQPVIVRESGLDNYELIAGERRWRAAQLAELTEIPAIIKSISDENALAIGLIENIQRQDLNPIEEAYGLKRLIDEFGLTHERIAEVIGRSRSSISNTLRLLSLPEKVQDLLYTRNLEMGHARALITLPETLQIELAQNAVKNGWSVREVERRVSNANHQQTSKSSAIRSIDDGVSQLQNKLSSNLGMKVSLRYNSSGRGKISFNFSTLDELDYLLKKLDCNTD